MATAHVVAASNTSCLQDIHLSRIILPEDQDCTHRDSSNYCRCVVRTGGDILRGAVEVFSCSNRSFIVEVRLEGICRTWTQKGDPTSPPSEMAEIRFLQEVDIVKYRPSTSENLVEYGAHLLEFTFKIPRRLISAHSDIDPRFLELYPSAQFGLPCASYPSRERYMQPLIFYRISTFVFQKNAHAQISLCNSLCERRITIMPTKAPDPPLYIGSYPREFVLESSTKLRSNLYSASMGDLRVSAEEAMSLNLAVDTPRASTYVPVKLSFTASDASSSRVEPYNWTIAVRSRIRLRIFYGTRVFDQEPTLQDTKSSHLSTRSEFTKEEVRYYSGLRWGMDRLSREGTAMKQGEVFSSPWTTRLYVTVSLPKSCVPSFLAPLAALRYSVILNISVAGMRSGYATVEAPVQVHRSLASPQIGETCEELSEMLESFHVRDRYSLWEGYDGMDHPGQLDEQLPRYRY